MKAEVKGIRPMACAAECGNPVSPLGDYVRSGGDAYHVECFLGPKIHAAERGMESSFAAERQEWKVKLAEAQAKAYSDYRDAQGAQSAPQVPPPADKPVLKRPEWDEIATKVIEKQIVNFGPMAPQSALKRFLWRLWEAFRDAGLIVQVVDEPAPVSEKKITLDEYLRGPK